MRDFAGKVAVVTGGASGIGRALGARFAAAGMKVVLADVEKRALDATVAELRRSGGAVTGITTDVSQQESVCTLADEVYASHGAVHVLCNNAGIGTDETRSQIWNSPPNDWIWAFRVNVWGVLHGIKAFVPRMLAGGEEGHVVNTSSANGGLYPLPTTPIYATTKAAVTTITEVLHHQLRMARAKVRASVLFPGPHIVATNIFDAARNRPSDLPDERADLSPPPTLADIRKMVEQTGNPFLITQPEDVAAFAFEALQKGDFWILPRGGGSDEAIRARVNSILDRSDPRPSGIAS
jgi:NAD(P)-dependent dehydrogenase (short-subunit alcohol dehydrogenase family)